MEAILQYEKKPADDYYAILGCDELSSVDQILAEYKSSVLSCHPDKHPDNPDAAEKFSKLQQAKETLTDPAERQLYDCWRRSGICLSYKDWKARKDAVQTSMHWASAKKKDAMLDECSASQRIEQDKKSEEAAQCHDSYRRNLAAAGWGSDSGNDFIRKFRNYQL